MSAGCDQTSVGELMGSAVTGLQNAELHFMSEKFYTRDVVI
jgi:hypothetical protein